MPYLWVNVLNIPDRECKYKGVYIRIGTEINTEWQWCFMLECNCHYVDFSVYSCSLYRIHTYVCYSKQINFFFLIRGTEQTLKWSIFEKFIFVQLVWHKFKLWYKYLIAVKSLIVLKNLQLVLNMSGLIITLSRQLQGACHCFLGTNCKLYVHWQSPSQMLGWFTSHFELV